MKLQGRYQTLLQARLQTQFGYIFAFMFVLLLTGCGGGGGDGGDTPPILTLNANAGNIVAVRVGTTAVLDGSLSTSPSADPLTFSWSFVSKPDLSNAALQNATLVNPSFTPDVVGSYRIQLIVTADGVSSERAIALVEASVSGHFTGIRVHTSYPSQCADCHDGRFLDPNVNPGLIDPKSGNHPSTSNICQACHTTFGFKSLSFVDHQEVFDNCSICHNGVSATGKSDFHVTTVEECDVCHTTNSFLTLDNNGKYDHTGITSGCAACHNGKTAIGKNQVPDPVNNPHPVTSVDCVSCHNVTSFKGAFPDHTAILADVTSSSPTQQCTTCHGPNSTAQDVKVGHPDMNTDCVSCHGITQFNMGGVFDHRVDASVVRCDTCHTDTNSINATGKGAATNPSHPTTTKDCGVCHGPSKDPLTGLRSFTNIIVDHSLLDPTTRCDTCHGVGNSGADTKKSVNHIDTIVDCAACHTPGNFLTGTFDHSVANMLGLSCSGCHDGSKSAGKTVNHIPTALECDSCHAADTPASPNSFKGALVDHSNITTNCVSCHDGVIQTGKSTNHLPTTADCVSCHTTATPLTFIGGTFDHQGVTTCASCHNGVIAIDKTNKGTYLTHIPSKGECSECHSSTDTLSGQFANKTGFMADVHLSLINGCEGCHTKKFFPTTLFPSKQLFKVERVVTNDLVPVVVVVGHVPTNQDCNSCHSNDTFLPKTPFTHNGITGNCESCHSGDYFFSANAMGKAQVPDPTNNPHPSTTADCGLCHGIGNNFTDGIFDHTSIVDNCSSCHGEGQTGAVIKMSSKTNPAHVTTSQDCSICHTPGTFKTTVFNHNQIVTDCASCHGVGATGATTTVLSVPIGKTHVGITDTNTTPPTLQDCSICHNTTAFAGAKYDHTGITTNCASCHDGLVALGKNGTHVPTSDDCSVCHKTTGMKPATFIHTGIVTNCVSCHDGIFAKDKNIGHVATTSDCGSCHTVPPTTFIANGATNGWIPAGFDHSGLSINTRCDSCHGVTATGMDKKTNPAHWATGFDCRDCHTTATFVGGTWKHDSSSAGTCDICHSTAGGARTWNTNTHISVGTLIQCDSCHTTTAWAPFTFKHNPNDTAQARYPGDHRAAINCVTCHGSTISAPFVYRDDKDPNNKIFTPVNVCAACHTRDFRPKGDHNGGENGTVEQNKNCAAGGCHRITDSSF